MRRSLLRAWLAPLVAVCPTLGVGCGLLTGLSDDRTYDLIEDANARDAWGDGAFDVTSDAARDASVDVVCRVEDFKDVRGECDACLAQNCCGAAMACKPMAACENFVACIQRECRPGLGVACPQALCGFGPGSPWTDIAVCAVGVCSNACGKR